MTPAVALLIVRAILAVSLYAFLGLALALMWRDLRRSDGRATGSAPGAHLAGLGEGADAWLRLPLAELNLIGRAADNTIRLEDDTVSAHHARLTFDSGQWILEDLGSRNGTRVNGIVVEGPMVVTHGDDLQFGEVRLGLRAGTVRELASGSTRPPSV